MRCGSGTWTLDILETVDVCKEEGDGSQMVGASKASVHCIALFHRYLNIGQRRLDVTVMKPKQYTFRDGSSIEASI